MQKFFFLCVFLCAVSTKVTAQDCEFTFKGKIIDFHDKTPIVGASVAILNLKKYTTSDLDGNFEINKLCKGKIIVEVRHISCDTKQITLNLNESISKEIFLEHHLEKLNEVVVKTNKKTEQTSVEQTIKKEVIADFTDKSLGDVLNTVSGVSSLNTGNAIVKPMIHGLHSSRLLIINNNVRQFDQEWGAEHAPNIDINASDRIDVVKGANTLMYGSDAIGGLILLSPKKYELKDDIFGSTVTSFNSNGLGGNINTELINTYKSGIYAKLQLNYKQFGDFTTPDYNLTNSGFKSLNGSFRFGYNSFEKGFDAYYSYVDNEFAILRSSHIGNVNDLVNAINNPIPSVIEDFSYQINNPRQTILHHLAKIEAYKRYKGFGKLTLQYDFQINRRKEFDTRRGDLKDTPVIDLRLFTTSIQPDLQIDYFDDLKINTGLLVRYQQNVAFSTGTRALIPDFDKYEAGVYAIVNYNLNETSEINAGIRYDFSSINASKTYNLTDWNETYNYDEIFPEFEVSTENTRILTNPEFTFHNVSASLGYSKQFNNDISLFVNYGLASRMPNPSELFSDGLHHSAARLEYGFLTMKKEVANKFVLSLEKKNVDFGFTISPYYKFIDDFIQLIPFGVDTNIRGAFPEWKYIQVDAQIFGIDVDIYKSFGDNFQYSGSLSLLQGNNVTDNIPLIHMPSNNFSNRLSYTHSQLNQFTIGISHKTILRQNRFPDYNFTTYNPIIQQDVFVDISSTPPKYSLFGLHTSSVFNLFDEGSLQLEFNIDNIFNISYREYLNRLRYFADDLGRNYNLKIKINY
jgi:iron complex outermembrane receptor protein